MIARTAQRVAVGRIAQDHTPYSFPEAQAEPVAWSVWDRTVLALYDHP
jgi:hypothetical protein